MLDCEFRDDLHAIVMINDMFFDVIRSRLSTHKKRILRSMDIIAKSKMTERDINFFLQQYQESIDEIDICMSTLHQNEKDIKMYHDKIYRKPSFVARNETKSSIDFFQHEINKYLCYLDE